MASPQRIAVIGAGIGGLTAALALARRGREVVVLERADRLSEVGAGLQISPNASRILIGLGLGPALEATAVTPAALRLYSTRAGGEVARVPLGPAAAARFGAPYWVIHRADLHGALVAAVAAEPLIGLQLGIQVRRVEPGPAGAAIVHVRNGRDERLDCAGVVGADGVWSMLRTGTIGGPPARFTGRIALRATIPIDEVPVDLRGSSGLWMAPRAHLVHYPVSAGRVLNLVAVVEGGWEEETWSVPVARDDVLRRFDPVGGTRWPALATALIAAPETWTGWALAGVDPRFEWTSGPVTLLGDAAHAMLPFAAQGAAMAIEDAAILAAVIDQHRDVPTAFMAYERQRKRRVAAVAESATTNGRVYHLSDTLALVRDAGLRVAGPRILDRQAWIYGWTPG